VSVSTTTGTDSRWFAPVAVLAFGTFAVGTDAFVISGLLPDIHSSLSVSIAAAGQLVTIFAIAYAVLSPTLGALTSGWPRRRVLITALFVFAAGNVATALAPSYPLVLASRLLAAAGASLFTPNAGTTAAFIAGERHRGRAIAVVTVGLSSSLALGAPLGTLIGNAFGWRATMWFLTILAMAVVPILLLRLKPIQLANAGGLRERLAPLRDLRIVRVLATTLLAFIGIFLLLTYISAVFAPAVAGHRNRIAVLLLVFGLTGTAGNLLAGRLADKHGPRPVVITATLALTAIFLAMIPIRSTFVAALPIVALSGVAAWSVTAPQQHRVIGLSSAAAAPLAVSLNAAVLYLGVSLSGAIGAVALTSFGTGAALLVIAAAFVFTAALVTQLSGRAEQRALARSPSAPKGRQMAPLSLHEH
jgi:MFS transporter, DHA1 family, inner membrane transport protein